MTAVQYRLMDGFISLGYQSRCSHTFAQTPRPMRKCVTLGASQIRDTSLMDRVYV